MCFWPVAQVELEDPPPAAKKKEEKKEDKPKPNYVMVSDQINLQPIMDWNVSIDNRVHVNHRPQASRQQPAAPTPAAPTPAPAANATATPAHNHVHMSHHYVYQPTTSGRQQRQQPAPNPWTGPLPPPDLLSQHWAQHWSQVAHFTPGYVACPLIYPAPFLAAPAAMHYPGQPHVQFYTSQPAAEPFNATYYPQPPTNQNQGGGSNAHAAQNNPWGQSPSQPNGPIQLVPQQPSPNQELWCRELDGNYTLRTVNKIMQDLQPGYWKRSVSGFPYWIRTGKT